MRRLGKKLPFIILVSLLFLLFSIPAIAATPALHEYLNTGGDADSTSVYGVTYLAEQFTSEATAHSVTSIRLNLKRVGSPGTMIVSLRNASAGLPTGIDLAYGYLNGSAISTAYTWYEITLNTEYALSASTQYAVVIGAPNGTVTDYISWYNDSGGGLANAVGSSSTNGGITWVDGSPKDYLFEIWGNTVMSVVGANVFTNYLVNGDMLITAECINVYPNYVNTTDPSRYFSVQLLNVAGTSIIAATPLKGWGYKPIGIYIAPSLAAQLTQGSAYIVRMIGNFSGTPSTTYVLQTSDWKGSNLIYLDKWMLSVAYNMNTYYGLTGSNLLTENITDVGEIFTITGGTYFTNGIPAVSSVRPDMFQGEKSQPDFPGGAAQNTYQEAFTWQEMVGAKVAADAVAFGNLFTIDGDTFLTILIMAIVGFVLIFVFFNTQGANTPVVLLLCIPLLLYANYMRVINIQVTLVISAILAFLFVRKFWWSST